MTSTTSDRTIQHFRIAWGVVAVLVLGFEASRWTGAETRAAAMTGWLCGRDADWLPYLPLVLAGIGLLRGPGPERAAGRSASPLTGEPTTGAGRWLSLALGLLGIAVAASVGWNDRGRPPVYHDEYSYLIQAETFLHGRTSFPSFEPLPQLFDQMHVLNEGRFASRYFPGAGAWFTLFFRWHPIYAQWLAQGIVVCGMSIVAGELAGRTARVIAGLAAAGSPGLVLFSQVFLAHHPTLAGLTLFLVEFLRFQRGIVEGRGASGRTQLSAGLAGLGLVYAMLCRPMTAAGVGLPFGVWLFANWLGFGRCPVVSGAAGPLREIPATEQVQWRHLVWMGLPIIAGIGMQLAYNRSITGSALVSPYQLYTDLYTPRHVYGFNNVVRGEQHLGPKVLDGYDRWAENLTLPGAIRKMGIRIVASSRWTMGLVPMVLLAVWLFLNRTRWSLGFRLLLASIASLHVVHLPYWFEGILGWHYVFESAALVAVVVGVVTADILQFAREQHIRGLRLWWSGMLLTSLATGWWTVPPLWPGRLPVGLAELEYPRQKYQRFEELLSSTITGPAIVLIQPDPADLHFDLVTNRPTLDAPILRARAPRTLEERQPIPGLFPDRSVWTYDVAKGELRAGISVDGQ